MKNIKHVISFRLTRFTMAGALNTAVNFAVLNLMYYGFHQNKFTAIVIATSCAVAVSFMLNRNFVFLDKERPGKKLARFIGVSIAGVFLIQNTIYVLCIVLLQGHDAGVAGAIQHITGIRLSNSFVDVNLSNLIASFVVMIWNYNGYRIFVFNSSRHDNDITESFSTEPA